MLLFRCMIILIRRNITALSSLKLYGDYGLTANSQSGTPLTIRTATSTAFNEDSTSFCVGFPPADGNVPAILNTN